MNSNQFEFVRQIAVTKFCRSDDEATRGDLKVKCDHRRIHNSEEFRHFTIVLEFTVFVNGS